MKAGDLSEVICLCLPVAVVPVEKNFSRSTMIRKWTCSILVLFLNRVPVYNNIQNVLHRALFIMLFF